MMQWFAAKAADTNHDLLALARLLEEGLWSKTFLQETDREVVRDIIRGFTAKRRLMQSIETNSLLDLEAVLEELREGHRLNFLDQPVDAKLNTPLHLAVNAGFTEGVRMLLDFGADKTLRNLSGDTPVQWYIWPRRSKAARVCREFPQRKRPSLLDTAWHRWYFSESGWKHTGKLPIDNDKASSTDETSSHKVSCSFPTGKLFPEDDKEAEGEAPAMMEELEVTTDITQSVPGQEEHEAEHNEFNAGPTRIVVSLDSDDGDDEAN